MPQEDVLNRTLHSCFLPDLRSGERRRLWCPVEDRRPSHLWHTLIEMGDFAMQEHLFRSASPPTTARAVRRESAAGAAWTVHQRLANAGRELGVQFVRIVQLQAHDVVVGTSDGSMQWLMRKGRQRLRRIDSWGLRGKGTHVSRWTPRACRVLSSASVCAFRANQSLRRSREIVSLASWSGMGSRFAAVLLRAKPARSPVLPQSALAACAAFSPGVGADVCRLGDDLHS